MKLDIHLHSTHSDGFASVRQVAERIKKLGIDGFALTDHDTVEGIEEAKKVAEELDLEFIPGVEVSAHEGHILAYGVEENIKKAPAAEVIDEIRDRGGIAVAAHPYDPLRNGIGELVEEIDVDYIESFNSRTTFPWCNWHADKTAKGLKVPETAGSDAHSLRLVGLSLMEMDKVEDLYKGKAEVFRKKWAGIGLIALEATRRRIRRLSNLKGFPFF